MADELGVPGTPEEINAAIVERMLARYGEAPPLIPGAVEAVRRAAARWPLAIASSSNPELIEVVLRAAGLRELFPVAVSSQEVARGKPAPDVYLEAARRLGVEPARVRRGRGLAQRHPLGEGGGPARRRRAEPALPARTTRRSLLADAVVRVGRRADARGASPAAQFLRGRAGRSRCGRRGPSRSRARRRPARCAPRSGRSRGRTRGRARGS